MNEETTKVDQIEKDAKATELSQAAELSEQSLEDVAGGRAVAQNGVKN